MNDQLIIKIYQQPQKTCMVVSVSGKDGYQSTRSVEKCCRFTTSHEDDPSNVYVENVGTIDSNALNEQLKQEGYNHTTFVCSLLGSFDWINLSDKMDEWNIDESGKATLLRSESIFYVVFSALLSIGLPRIEDRQLCCRAGGESDVIAENYLFSHSILNIKSLINLISTSKHQYLKNHPEVRHQGVEDETHVRQVINKQFALYAGVSIIGLAGGILEVIYTPKSFHAIGWTLICISSIALGISYLRESPTVIRSEFDSSPIMG